MNNIDVDVNTFFDTPKRRPTLPLALEMVRIPAGIFEMGYARKNISHRDEYPLHTVVIERPIMAQVTPVTLGQWFYAATYIEPTRLRESDSFPVTNINWFHAVAFCNILSMNYGYAPCYYLDNKYIAPLLMDDVDMIPLMRSVVSWDKDANGFRLPTEAEWEYMCKCGLAISSANENDDMLPAEDQTIYNINDLGWNRENSDGVMQQVGTKPVNGLGMYDMLGCVWEWCWDWYSNDYYSRCAGIRDPSGPACGKAKVARGGSSIDAAHRCTCTARHPFKPTAKDQHIGMRVVRNGA